ncbi:MAG: hypothetical protein WCF84_21035 [Anaerolineae bacterium]
MSIDAEKNNLADHLLELLDEEDNPVLDLNQQSDAYRRAGRLQEAIHSCQVGQEHGREAQNPYAQGAARLHLGLHYFVLREHELDRAANLCEDAARFFHSAERPEAEAVALLAVAKIMEYACEHQRRDRWQRALTAMARAVETCGDRPSPVKNEADTSYKSLAEHHSDHLKGVNDKNNRL